MLQKPAFWSFFFFNDTATTEIYTLSLHDALSIRAAAAKSYSGRRRARCRRCRSSFPMAHSPPPARFSGGSGIPPETNKNANQKGNTQSTTIDRRRVPMLRQGLGCWAVALSALLLPREGGTAEIKNYSPVTDQRLANPE